VSTVWTHELEGRVREKRKRAKQANDTWSINRREIRHRPSLHHVDAGSRTADARRRWGHGARHIPTLQVVYANRIGDLDTPPAFAYRRLF